MSTDTEESETEYVRGGKSQSDDNRGCVGSDCFDCPFCDDHSELDSMGEWTAHLEDRHGIEGPL